MAGSTARAAILLIALAFGGALANKGAQVSEACVEGNCKADPQPLKGQSILQVKSLDHSSAPVPADLVGEEEEEDEDAEVEPQQALKKGAKKSKNIKGKVLLQTEASSWSKGAPVEEDTRVAPAEVEESEEVIESEEVPSEITREEEEEILRHIKRAEDIGVFDRQHVSSHPELAQIDKMGAWAKFQQLGHLGDGVEAYEKTREKGTTSEYLKAREFFERSRHQKAAKKAEPRKAKANALVQTNNKKSKAQLLGEDKFHADVEEDKFSTDLHVSAEEEKVIRARIEQAKASGAIRPPTKESHEKIKEMVRHVKILQSSPILDAKAHNLAVLQKAKAHRMALLQQDAVSYVDNGEEQEPGDEPPESQEAVLEHATHHGQSAEEFYNEMAAEAEASLTDEEARVTEEELAKTRLLPPDSANEALLQNSAAAAEAAAKSTKA